MAKGACVKMCTTQVLHETGSWGLGIKLDETHSRLESWTSGLP